MALTADTSDIFRNNDFYSFDQDIERKISLEILDNNIPETNEQINTGAESHSHNMQKRSMRLNFRTQYGNREWKTDFFESYSPLNGGSATSRHRTLILRAGNNRSWARSWHPDVSAYSADQFYRDSYLAMTGVDSRGAYVHLYLNGVYWGIYNVAERPDEQFQAEYFDGDDDDWFYTNHGGVGNADSTRWDSLNGQGVESDMSNPDNYSLLQEYLIVERYIILSFLDRTDGLASKQLARSVFLPL